MFSPKKTLQLMLCCLIHCLSPRRKNTVRTMSRHAEYPIIELILEKIYSASNALWNFGTYVGSGWWTVTRRPSMSHIYSIELKLDENGGHYIRLISTVLKQCYDVCSWRRASSSINTNSAPVALLSKHTCCSRSISW